LKVGLILRLPLGYKSFKRIDHVFIFSVCFVFVLKKLRKSSRFLRSCQLSLYKITWSWKAVPEQVVNIPLVREIINYLLNSNLSRHLVNETIISLRGPKEKGRKWQTFVDKETFNDIYLFLHSTYSYVIFLCKCYVWMSHWINPTNLKGNLVISTKLKM